jgi:hypothetical protein
MNKKMSQFLGLNDSDKIVSITPSLKSKDLVLVVFMCDCGCIPQKIAAIAVRIDVDGNPIECVGKSQHLF